MTDEIDLDELDVASDDEERPNRGDWFWRGEGEPSEEPEAGPAQSPSTVTPDGESVDGGDAVDRDGDADAADVSADPVPHVPRENKGKPAGIPVESGGAGGGAADADADAPEHPDADDAASGPHGGGVDDMTMALTYEAAKRLAEPQLAIRDAKTWTDWLGIVGDVEAFVISTFQRDHGVDVDFFSGAGQSPGERLADIDEHSMFYAERMVLVGLPEDEQIAARADWEFVPLSTAAEKADWELSEAQSDG